MAQTENPDQIANELHWKKIIDWACGSPAAKCWYLYKTQYAPEANGRILPAEETTPALTSDVTGSKSQT